MKNVFAIVAITLTLAACGPGFKGKAGPIGPQGPQGPAAPITTPIVDGVQSQIDEIISQKNEDRALLAQAPLTSGLSCTVQQVTSGGQCLTYRSSYTNGCTAPANLMITSGTIYTYLYKGDFNQANSSGSSPILLLPSALRPIFAGKNFKITCTGQIVVLDSDYYDFSLNSDDGSLLYLNGGLVVNNDASHGMTLKTGTTLLYRGIQAFQLQYAQTGSGNFGLILQAGGQLIDPKYYFH